MLPFAVVALVIFFFVGIVVLASIANRNSILKRNALRRDWGARYGLTMLDPVDPSIGMFFNQNSEAGKKLLLEHSHFKAMNHYSQSAVNILQGQIGDLNLTVFDYKYVVSSGKSSTTYYFGVISTPLSSPVPNLEIRSTSFWDKVTAFFGKRDMEVGQPEFDKEFFLSCDDEGYLKRVLDGQTMSIVEQHDRQVWYVSGNRLVSMRYGNLSNNDYDALLAGATGLAERIASV